MEKCSDVKKLPFTIYALCCLLVVGVVFYTSYGTANAVSAQRAPVAEIAFGWEKHIPFYAWTIFPYWSLNIFYALAFFLCRNRCHLHNYMKQLLLAQVIAVTAFMLFPLQFSWEKPPSSGISGWLFQSLASFDKPYNQAPSLHIILTVIVGRFYWHYLSEKQMLKGRLLWLLWCLLIAISVLTTYQHHFIDIPTGLLVGAFICWLFPVQPIIAPHFRFNYHKDRRRWAMFYLGGALVALLLAGYFGGAFLWLLWLSVSALFLALAYAFFGADALQKQGRHSMAVSLLLLPYFVVARLNIAYWLYGKAKHNVVLPRIHIGSIIEAGQYTAVLDVCAEYPCRQISNNYQSVPMLDMVTADAKQLCRAADALQHLLLSQKETVLVCCALGYGRSAAVIMTWLLRHGGHNDWCSAWQVLNDAKRPIVLMPAMQTTIKQAAGLRECHV